MSCNDCQRSTGCPIRPQLSRDSRVLIILPAPPFKEGAAGAFTSNGAQVVMKIVTEMNNKTFSAKSLDISPSFTYAVRCAMPIEGAPDWSEETQITAADIENCKGPLQATIDDIKPKFIIAMGIASLKILDLKIDKLGKVRGQWQNYKGIHVMPTFSPFDLQKKPGLFNVFKRDIGKVWESCVGLDKFEYTLETPTTFTDIMSTLDQLELQIESNYKATGKPLGLSLDIETTSLQFYVPWAKIIAISYSYEKSKAVCMPLFHKSGELIDSEVTQIMDRLYSLIKSRDRVALILANGKFDLQYLKHWGWHDLYPSWDCLIAEHLLDEDKKGNYGLKVLTTDYFVSMSGYDDKLEAFKRNLSELFEHRRNVMFKDHIEAAAVNLKNKLGELEPQQRTSFLSEINKWGILKSNVMDKLFELINLHFIDGDFLTHKGAVYKKKVIMNAFKTVVSTLYNTEAFPTLGIEVKPVRKLTMDDLEMLEIDDDAEPIDEIEHASDDEIYLDQPDYTYEDIPLQMLLDYCALDALMTFNITKRQIVKMRDDDLAMQRICVSNGSPEVPTLFALNQNLLMPAVHLFIEMEYEGITLNREKCQQYIDELSLEYETGYADLTSKLGYKLNIHAPQDLVKYLYIDKALPILETTKKGAPKVSEDVLKKLSELHGLPELKLILNLKKIQKCIKTYLTNWLEMSKYDGKIRTSYLLNGTATGRLSSARPNLQNVPFKLGNKNLKELFIPDKPGDVLVDCDIKNAEIRVLTAYSHEPSLIHAFEQGMDLHTATAEKISGLPFDQIQAKKEDKDSVEYLFRQLAKTLNFGIIYGITAMGIVGQTDMTYLVEQECIKRGLNYKDVPARERYDIAIEIATFLIQEYFVNNPGIDNYFKETVNFANKYKVVYSLMGRRRRFDLVGYLYAGKKRMERQAVNAKIQGTSSDIVMTNMIYLQQELKKIGGKLVLTVHDSMCFQVSEERLPEVKRILEYAITEKTAELYPWLPVAWKYDAAYGPTYGTAKLEF